MKKIKSRVSFVLLIILSLVLLTGCTTLELSEDFNESEVEAVAKKVFNIINDRDTEALKEIANPDMKKALTDEVMEEIYEILDEAGEFEEITEIKINGQDDDETGEQYAEAVMKTKYELGKPFYNFTFNKDMELSGLFFK